MSLHTVLSVPRLVALIVVATLVSAAASAQTATFARNDYHSLGSDHLAADFNGDGKLDLAGLWAKTAAIMLGNGDGTFQAMVEYPVADWNQALAAGDFNRDGALDLIVTINNIDIGLSLLMGRGDGTFNPAVNLPNTARFDAPAIAALDVDNSGTLDIVIGHNSACYTAPCVIAQFISVMKGNGDGTFQPPAQIDIGSSAAEIAVGDFNRDGIKDLGIASSSSRVHVLLGAGDGTFSRQTLTLVPTLNLGMDNTDIDVADLNGDSIDDLVVAMSLNGSKTVILLGVGDGTFQPAHFITEPDIRIPQYQAIADYNGDGRLDLALSLGFGLNGLMEIRNGNGDGTFGPITLYLPPGPLASVGGQHIIAADFNADGKADLALGWAGASNGLAVLRNTTGATPPPTSGTPGTPSLVSPSSGATVPQPVTLDWNNVTNAASYEVQVDNSSTIASPFVANPTVTASQVTLSGLPAQQLWWRVRARNAAGVFGPFSSVRRFTPQAASVEPTGPAATLTVTATGRSGERVTSTPTGINVSVGSTGSASFTTGTSITLRVTNSRDAIWSGACSSGGSKTKTCTFVLNGNATVNANVQ
jgi:hypothetical protein